MNKFSIVNYDTPRFAQQNTHPFEDIVWVTRNCGTQEEEQVEVECPEHWSQDACNIAASRYLRRGGIPNQNIKNHENIVPPIINERETSIKQLIHRIAWFLAHNNQVLQTKEHKNNYYSDLCYLLVHQIIGFNTPAWINGGLFDVYGIKGSSRERYWTNPKTNKTETIPNELIHPGMSACYLTGVEDQLIGTGGMYDYINTEMRVFTVGAGNGANISNIRGKGEPIAGGGIAEGILPFLKIPDTSAAYIKSGGVSRRAARMVICDDDHPDIIDFINWKGKEEEKVLVMAEGYIARKKTELMAVATPPPTMEDLLNEEWIKLTDFRGELYSTVSGQQSNNSVRCSNNFLKAVENNENWELVWRTNPDHKITIKAKDIWNAIIHNAWKSGDPGVLYGDTINEWNTVPHYGEIVTVNPCAEISQPNFASCNLCSLNLVKFIEDFQKNKFENFIDTAKIIIMSLETITYAGSHPTPMHAKVTTDLRPLGANIGNIGAFLMREGLPYDSEEGRKMVASITGLFTAACWEASGEIATVLGPYFFYDRKNHYKIITKHLEILDRIGNKPAEKAFSMYGKMYENKEIKFRNNAVTCMVPTGTIGIIMDFDTFGMEPDFSIVKIKKLSDGGWMKIINQSVIPALQKLGYSDIEQLSAKIIENGTTVGIVKPEHEAIFDCAMKCNGGRYINIDGHLNMMAAIVPNISMNISKTVNMPYDSTEDDVSEVFMKGWKLGLKSVTIYRDGSKISQPLNVIKQSQEISEEDVQEALKILKEAIK